MLWEFVPHLLSQEIDFFEAGGEGVRLLFSDIRETSLLLHSLPRLVQQSKCVLSSCPRRMSVQPELTECILVEQLLFHTVLALYSSVLLLVWSQIDW